MRPYRMKIPRRRMMLQRKPADRIGLAGLLSRHRLLEGLLYTRYDEASTAPFYYACGTLAGPAVVFRCSTHLAFYTNSVFPIPSMFFLCAHAICVPYSCHLLTIPCHDHCGGLFPISSFHVSNSVMSPHHEFISDCFLPVACRYCVELAHLHSTVPYDSDLNFSISLLYLNFHVERLSGRSF